MKWPQGAVRLLHTRDRRSQLGILWASTCTLARYGTTIPPLRPQQPFTQPPPYGRPTSKENCLRTEPSPRRRPRATAHEIFPVRSSPIQDSESPARHTVSPSRGPQASSSHGRGNPFAPTQGITHRSHGPNLRFHEFTNPIGFNTLQGIHVPKSINYTSTPLQHTFKPTSSFCSLRQLENEYVQEGPDSDLPLEFFHFLLIIVSMNDSGTSQNTFLLMQIARMTTLTIFLLKTLPLLNLSEVWPLLNSFQLLTSHTDGCQQHHT